MANANTAGNNGTYTILALTASTIDVATASFTADTEDTTATFGPLDPTNSPDTTMNVSIDNRNEITLFLRERGGGAHPERAGSAHGHVRGARLYRGRAPDERGDARRHVPVGCVRAGRLIPVA